jgi:flagellar biosynthesis/type III secretory pathway protein FliH
MSLKGSSWIAAAAATGLAVIALTGPAAAADKCLDQVRDLAAKHGTPSKPPTASPDKRSDVTTQDLARSGGVIKPPPVDDKSVITPRSTTQDAMPTVPDVGSRALKQEPAADRTKLQAALTAAREQAEQGNEKGCQEALERARTLADRSESK